MFYNPPLVRDKALESPAFVKLVYYSTHLYIHNQRFVVTRCRVRLISDAKAYVFINWRENEVMVGFTLMRTSHIES